MKQCFLAHTFREVQQLTEMPAFREGPRSVPWGWFLKGSNCTPSAMTELALQDHRKEGTCGTGGRGFRAGTIPNEFLCFWGCDVT